MAWIVGNVSDTELRHLRSIGWEPSDPSEILTPEPCPQKTEDKVYAFYVDNDVLSIMSGPDWDKPVGNLYYKSNKTKGEEMVQKIINWVKKFIRILCGVICNIHEVTLAEWYNYDNNRGVSLLAITYRGEFLGCLFHLGYVNDSWRFDLFWLRQVHYREFRNE